MLARARIVVALAVMLVVASLLSAQDKGLASTPPMGWNSWNKFGCNVSEDLIRQMADAMVKSGMKDAGYQYVVIDDCWQVERDTSGNIVADPKRFPSGIKALADYVHSLGLKFGIYSDAGSMTCAKRPGSLGHEYQDALQYAAWGVDYLKYDWCNTTTQDAQAAYALIRNALNATGRPIVLSICEWGTAKPWLWGEKVGGNLWRTTGDISDMWESNDKHHLGMVDILDLQDGLESLCRAGPLERSRHAGSRQRRHDHGRIPRPLQPVVAARGSAACRQRFARHEAGDSRHPDQQGSDRGESGSAREARVAGCARMAIWKSGPSRCRMEAGAWSFSTGMPAKSRLQFHGKTSAIPLT